MNARRDPKPNKFPAVCNGCCQKVAAGDGVFEVVGQRPNEYTRIRCKPCVKEGRKDGPEEPDGRLANRIGAALSDDPMQFVVFHDRQWKIALTYAQMETFIAMIDGGVLARD